MKPAPFDYVSARSVDDAVETLRDAGEDGKVLAGGQSLIPMINYRLVRPSVIVDINSIPGLDSIEERGERLRIGATVRHHMTAANPLIRERAPVLHAAMRHVAHMTVRNRGTFCGSICHADPSAEMPMISLLLDGEIEARSVRGSRRIAAADFFVASLINALEPDELVTAIEIDSLPSGSGWGFEEFARRHGDFALASAAVTLRREGDVAHSVRFAMMGVGDTPLRLSDVESACEGRAIDDDLLHQISALLVDTLQPNSDLQASAEYRRHLAGVLATRALKAAWKRASTATVVG